MSTIKTTYRKMVFAGKLYLKQLLKSNLSGWVFSVFNFMLIMLVMVFVLDEHGEMTAAEATELAQVIELAFWALLSIPVVAAALALLIGYAWKQYTGKEIPDEIWPEVSL